MRKKFNLVFGKMTIKMNKFLGVIFMILLLQILANAKVCKDYVTFEWRFLS